VAYEPIKGIPDLSSVSFPELKALSDVWAEERRELEGTPAHAEFVKKLQREWAIETGIIERLYAWDRGVTQLLIEKGIEAAVISHHAGVSQEEAAHIQALIRDQLGIVEGLFGFVKGDQPLTEHFIRGLQARFTAQQETTEAITPDGVRVQVPLVKGCYKSQPNNPKRPDGSIAEYCPPEMTKAEMERLVAMYREAEGKKDPVILAAWLHHRFTQIHPFQDGNGRVARTLASLVFLREGMFPLVIRESNRDDYISALEIADEGDLLPLCKLFAKIQGKEIVRALSLEQQAQQSKHADQIIRSAMEVLKDRYEREAANVRKVFPYAKRIEAIAFERLSEIARDLDGQLESFTPPTERQKYCAFCKRSDEDSRHFFYKQIISNAKAFDYYANLHSYREWIQLTIKTTQTFDFVLSVHGIGSADSGILAVSPFTYLRAPREDEGGTDPIDVHPASPDYFQFNYAEPIESIEERFRDWLEASVAIALAEWKRTIR